MTTMPIVNRDAGRKLLPPTSGSIAFAELWERFSFYGLQAVLFFYLVYTLAQGGLALSPAVASSIVGAYSAGVYVSQVAGAWVGDRLLTPRMTVLIGGLGILAGHIILAIIPALTGLGIGLGLIVLGTGALKTNITSLFGMVLDEHGTPSRDSSFSYYYFGIGLGATLGPLVTGFLQSRLGFHWAFSAAAIGMGLGLIIYLTAFRTLPEAARMVRDPISPKKLRRVLWIVAALTVLIVLAITMGWITVGNLALVMTAVAVLAAVVYFVVLLTSRLNSTAEKRQVVGFLPLFAGSCVFFALSYQIFTSVSALLVSDIDLMIGNWEFPAAWVSGITLVAPLVCIPIIAAVWKRQGEDQPSVPAKFATALLIQGASFGSLVIGSLLVGSWSIPLLLLIIALSTAMVGECFLGPVALSLVTRIGPDRSRGQMIALYFLSMAIGSALAGVLGGLFAEVGPTMYFTLISALAVVAGLALLGLRTVINGRLR